MNRILIDKELKNIGKVKDDVAIINVEKESNVLIEKNNIKKYVFNIKNADLNVLCIKENSCFTEYEFNINGGKVSFNNVSYSSDDVKIKVNLNNSDSSIIIYNSVIATKENNYDIRINHYDSNTKSDVYNNGVTVKSGTINFDVSSYVKNGKKDCLVNQDSKIVTLNETNNNTINPILLIDEYEVEARHAAFIGNFNSSELFYLMSRGLRKKEAENLLINGLLIGVLDICFNEKENLKKKLNEDWG